ncbi:DMT family transporter [Ruegeria aquimaris]|uniref:DMT family transporter n=1 Tax=Ruegeria aquimaris TaxID=2984333 RepID=A0ABT3AQ12_9RHOB|nr:DMT family transporter [Ruegeria sp. XHP0148]MCV2890754.1 DMT family transporter [Ruegeria sp. XHP0148]
MSRQAENLSGSLYMVAAMGAFALEDMFVKSATAVLPVGQVLILFGLGGMGIFALLARLRGEAALVRPDRTLAIRSGFEVMGRICYTLALALTPLTSTSAILQATPLVVAMGAALFLGETVGWRRWVAILIGLAGVLLILRPGMQGFVPASIFAVLGMIGFAGRDLATRAARARLSNAQLGVYGFGALVVSGALALGWTGGAAFPDWSTARHLGAAILFGVLAYECLTRAMRRGEISVIAPFRYTRLVFAMILGIVVFGETPDAATWIGSAIIVAGGIYTILREGRARR